MENLRNKRVVHELPGMREARVERREYFSPDPGKPLTLDLYFPKDHAGALRPAVVTVLGYADAAGPTPFGCQFREMGMYVSWAQLFAASGMVGVLYESSNPAKDAGRVLEFLSRDGESLGIDPKRIGVWSVSGNVPVALSVLMDANVRCGALAYGFTLDLDGSSDVAKAATQFYFANPVAGRTVEDLPKDTALFLARAGQEQFAGLNDSMDRFVSAALRCNLPITVMNHPTGPHGFDYADDSARSKEIIAAILAFLRTHLVV